MQGIGPKLPLQRDHRFGNYDLIQNYGEQIKQNFKNLLLTSPGERIMNPDFGVGLRNFLFEPRERVKSLARQRIDEQVAKYMPFIKITKVIMNSNKQNNNIDDDLVLSVIIEYIVPSLNLDSQIVIDTRGSL
tara:strand:- start:1055 stop:1450 length:396 start_codon:yes stop_codon:yes gene_type:complete